MRYTLLALVVLFSFKAFPQSSDGKTFDTQMVPLAKLPILNWKSEHDIDRKPSWEGFLLVKAKLNGIYDISGGLQDQETFNVGQIDVWGDDDRKRFAMDMHQTQLRIWSRRKTKSGDFVGYLEGDFWGGNGSFRMRTAWFDYKFMHIGQDWSFFGDKDVWPNVLDWDGPPSGVWRRAPQVKFYFNNKTNFKFEIGFENPGAEFIFNEEIAPQISPSYPLLPDIIGAIRKDFGSNYLRISAIYRNLNYDYAGETNSKTGFGVSLSGYFKTHSEKKDLFQFQVVGGTGISSYLASFGGRNYDGVPTGSGTIETIPVIGAWVAYEYFFSSKWHANLVMGLSDFVSPAITQLEIGPTDIFATDTVVGLDHKYIVLNLLYDPTPGLTLGIEYNLGNRDISYEGNIDMNGTSITSMNQARSAQRVGFGAFFDF